MSDSFLAQFAPIAGADNRRFTRADLNRFAGSLDAHGTADIADWGVVEVEDGWDTSLVFTHKITGECSTVEISSDGPHHAAEQAVRFVLTA